MLILAMAPFYCWGKLVPGYLDADVLFDYKTTALLAGREKEEWDGGRSLVV